MPADARLLEADLPAWAGPRVAAGGRNDALLGRVEALRLSFDGTAVDARVRGNRSLPYQVQVRVADAELRSHCTCSREARAPCRHAVAALEALRFPRPDRGEALAGRRRSPGRVAAGRGRVIRRAEASPGFVIVGGTERLLTRDERIAAARREEVFQRRQAARGLWGAVRPLPDDGGPPRFEVGGRRNQPVHTVTLRGDGSLASCTCEDFAENELQTCAHVEKLRTWLSRRPRRERPDVPPDMLSLWWQPRAWPLELPDPLREIRIDGPGDGVPEPLRRWFDREGWLRPPADGEIRGAGHLRVAMDAARDHAECSGLRWDLDAAVVGQLAAAEQAEGQRADPPSADSPAWRRVVEELRVTLHPYQVEGTLFLAGTRRAFLADDMGLGKTVQAVAAAQVLSATAGIRKVLVVCPASLKHQWRAEIDKVSGRSAQVVEGPRLRRLAAYESWEAGWLVLNYELVLRDLEALQAARADLVILDEAQRIKNWNTQTARAVKQLSSPRAFVLTGTPLENRLGELHSLVEFLHKRALGPRWRLYPLHAVTDEAGRVIAYEGLDVLRRRLGGFFLRRERSKVLDQLPERTDNVFWTGLGAAQRRAYRKHAAMAATLLGRQGALGAGEVRALLLALTSMRVLCNAGAQYDWERWRERVTSSEPPRPGELRALQSPKLEEFARVLDDLLDDSQEKLVVFSQWERALRLAHFVARDALARRDLRAEVFHGGLSPRARAEMVEAFRTDPEFRVLFSTDAGGLGLNLQDAASIVVNLEVPWNPAVLEQRVGRVHRLGQRHSVQVLHFVTRGAIEERVRRVVESKRALFDGLLVDEADRVVFDAPARASFMERVRALVDGEAQAPGA